jgi:hypothetical protein
MNYDQLIRSERRKIQNPKRWIWSAMFGAVVILIAFAVFNRRGEEPEFEGTPLSVHLSHLVQPESSKDYQTAAKALADAGTNALPVVLRIIQHPEPWYIRVYFQQQTNLPRWLQQQARKQLDPFFYQHRFQGAIRAVGLLGTNAAPIANELVAELPRLENSGRTPLSESLVKVGPAVVEPIKPLLTSTNMRTRSLAAYVCYMLHTESAGAAPELIDGLLDGDANHQRLVGQTLARMGREVAPVVLELLSSTNRILITAGLEAANGNVLQSSLMAEKMLNQLDHPDPEIRRAAALLITRKWPANYDQVAERLQPKAANNVRIADYLLSLQMVKEHRARLLSVLKEGLKNPDIKIQLECAVELIRQQSIDEDVIFTLTALAGKNLKPEFKNRVDYHRRQIMEILSAQTNLHPDTVPALQSSP